jgi:hypothetical protein
MKVTSGESLFSKLNLLRRTNRAEWCLATACALGTTWWFVGWTGASTTIQLMATALALLVLLIEDQAIAPRHRVAVITITGALAGVIYAIPMLFYIWKNWFVLRIVFSPQRILFEPLIVIVLCVVVAWLTSWVAWGIQAVFRVARALVKRMPVYHRDADRLNRDELGTAIVFLGSIICAVMLAPAVERIICLRLARHYHYELFIKTEKEITTPVSPLERWFFILQYGYSYELADRWRCPEGFLRTYEACRDRLVRLGTLKHKRFEFIHVRVGNRGAQILRAALRTFPDSIIEGPNWVPGNRFILNVWSPPDNMPKWEEFVRRHDVPSEAKTSEMGDQPG